MTRSVVQAVIAVLISTSSAPTAEPPRIVRENIEWLDVWMPGNGVKDQPPLDRGFTNPRLGVLASSDGGKTWTEHGDVKLTDDDRYFGWAEPTLTETADGRIVMLIRAESWVVCCTWPSQRTAARHGLHSP